MSRRIGPRGLDELRDELIGRDVAIVRQVADLRLMSGSQIEAVHFSLDDHATAGAAARAARRTLEQLTFDDLLVRLQRRIGGIRAGSSSFIYALGPVGHRILAETTTARPRLREPSLPFVDHTLAIAQLCVDLTLAARRGEHEVLGLQTEPWCWRRYSATMGGEAILRPDLFVAVGRGDFEHRWFIEVDRGTEHLPTLLRKCRAYDGYYRSGVEQAEHDVFPRVAWLVSSSRRRTQLRAAIDRDRHLVSEMFEVVENHDVLGSLVDGGES
jgi:hypothetical protein